MNGMAKKKQFELTTNFNSMDMPYQVFANNKADALNFIHKKLRKGERIISLKQG